MPSKDAEYKQTVDYIMHMYETRHKIFHFCIIFSAALLTVVFKLLHDNDEKFIISTFTLIISIVFTLMAKRSIKALVQFEMYAEKLEKEIGYNLITYTNNKLKGGINTNWYFLSLYWLLVVMWLSGSVYFFIKL